MFEAQGHDVEDIFFRIKGETCGPISFNQLRRMVEAGRMALDTEVARGDSTDWKPVGEFISHHNVKTRLSVPPSVHVTVPMQKPAPASLWTKSAAVGAVLTPVALVACAVLAWKTHEADAARAKAENESLRAQLHVALADLKDAVEATASATWVRADTTVSSCRATSATVECTVTNVTARPVDACWIGQLSQKHGGGRMRSFPLCSGRVGPRETRHVSVPWEEGHAEDICNRISASGNKVLDFDTCTFEAKAIDPQP